MKKKLLTVLLAVVMVFGVFGLTACGPANADDYNYFSSVYTSLEDEDDIRIHSIVYLAFSMMESTGENYLVYTGGAWDSKAQNNIKDVNDLAKAYDVEVYNFDLKLDGGLAAAATKTEYKQEKMTDGTIVNYAQNTYVNDANLIAGSPVALIRDAMIANGFDTNKDGKVDEATLFVVKNGKVVQSGSDAESMELAIQKTAIKKPSYAAGAEDGKYLASGFNASNIKKFDYFGDSRMHMAGEYTGMFSTEGSDYSAKEGYCSVYEVITLHAFIDILKNCKGDYSVFFGGAWCPNTQAIAFITNDVAKKMGVNRVFFFDPNLDGSSINIRTSNCNKPTAYNADKTQVTANDITLGWKDYRNPYEAKRWGKELTTANTSFSGLYALLVDTIAEGGTEYKSYWNEKFNTNNHTLWINGKEYSRMCVPNIMAFSSGELVNWKEAEYYFDSATYDEESPEYKNWFDASVEIMEENANALPYTEPVVEEEGTGSGEGSGSGATPPPSSGGGELC